MANLQGIPSGYRITEVLLVFFIGVLGGLLVYPAILGGLGGTEQTESPVHATLDPQAVLSGRMPVLAVRSDNNAGIETYVDAEIQPGKGRVLINTNPFVEPDTQLSAETAVKVAENYTKTSLKDRDVIITFSADTQLVGGPSAGSSMTLALIAAMEGKTPNAKMAMTGTIESDGSIGQVGGVLEKAQAASEQGAKTFLVPKGQSVLTYYEPQVTQRQRGPFVIQEVQYVPKTLDLKEYANTTWGLDIWEVATIGQAAAAFGL